MDENGAIDSSSGTRRRYPIHVDDLNPVADNQSRDNHVDDGDNRPNLPLHIDGRFWTGVALILVFIMILVHLVGSSCTGFSILPRRDLETHRSKEISTSFECEFAQSHLFRLTSHGPRVVGSQANEVFAPKFIMDELAKFSTLVSNLPKGLIDTEFYQVDNGTFTLSLLNGGHFASVYRKVGSVVQRIRGRRWLKNPEKSSDALLINCHYDSVTSSPGAGDNAVSCAVQIEVTRAILAGAGKNGSGLPEHDLIFLYNGAEENMLQASHAFITQHRWAHDIRVFINLDSAGSGGREIVFQTGPHHPWLIWEYAKLAPYPFASVVGQDLFQGGLIPSDTDFRIFRDYGKIPGIDIAYIANGYVYHTEYDTADRVSLPCINRAGENLLALVSGLGNSKLLIENDELAKDSAIFFDVLGLFMIVYPFRVGTMLNFITVIVSYIFLFRRYVAQSDRSIVLLSAIGYLIGCIVFISVSLLIVSLFVTYILSKPLSWYALNVNLIGLYIFPMTSAFFMYWSLFPKNSSPQNELTSMYSVFDIYYDAVLLLISTILFFTSFSKLGSVFIFCIWVLFPLLGRAGFRLYLSARRSHQLAGWHHQLLLYVLATTFPTIIIAYLAHTSINVFVPILGRSFGVAVPDIFVSVLILLLSVLPLLYLSAWARSTKRSCLRKIGKIFFHFTISWLLMVAFTRFGSSYSESDAYPRKQRGVVVHMNREFRDDPTMPDLVTRHDSGMWLLSLDYNRYPINENGYTVTDIKCDGPEPYCGIPYLYPVAHAVKRSVLVNTENHRLKPVPRLQVVSRSPIGNLGINITFSVVGPPHTHVYISVAEGVELSSWSVGDEGLEGKRPKFQKVPFQAKGKHYFVYYSYGGGKAPTRPLYIWCVFSLIGNSAENSSSYFRVALGGQYLFGHGTHSNELLSFLRNKLDEQTILQWSSTYSMWTFDLKKERSYFTQA